MEIDLAGQLIQLPPTDSLSAPKMGNFTTGARRANGRRCFGKTLSAYIRHYPPNSGGHSQFSFLTPPKPPKAPKGPSEPYPGDVRELVMLVQALTCNLWLVSM